MWRPIESRVGERDREWEQREKVQEKRGGEGERSGGEVRRGGGGGGGGGGLVPLGLGRERLWEVESCIAFSSDSIPHLHSLSA